MRFLLRHICTSALVALVATGCSKKEDKKADSKASDKRAESAQRDESQASGGPSETTATANPCAAPAPSASAAKVASAPPAAVDIPVPGDKKPDPSSLFSRLGGKDAIAAVVDDAVANILADKRINNYFAQADVLELKAHLVDQICQMTGGPCVYKGRPARERYKGKSIGEVELAAVLEAVDKSLTKHDVKAAERKELLAALLAMKGDIVKSGPAAASGKSGTSAAPASPATP